MSGSKSKLNSLQYFLLATSSLSVLAGGEAYGAAVVPNRVINAHTQTSAIPGFVNGDNISLGGAYDLNVDGTRAGGGGIMGGILGRILPLGDASINNINLSGHVGTTITVNKDAIIGTITNGMTNINVNSRLSITGREVRASRISINNNSPISFANGLAAAVPIVTNNPGQGNVTYNGAGEVGQVGAPGVPAAPGVHAVPAAPIGDLTFTGGGDRNLTAAIYATNIIFDGGTFNLSGNINATGNINFGGGTFNAANDAITINGAHFVGAAPANWHLDAANNRYITDRAHAAAERDRLEAERLAREAAERDRLAAEERDRLAAVERDRLEAERVAREAEARRVAAIPPAPPPPGVDAERDRVERIRLAEEARVERIRLAREAREEEERIAAIPPAPPPPDADVVRDRIEAAAREREERRERARAAREAERLGWEEEERLAREAEEARIIREAEEEERLAREVAAREAERLAAEERERLAVEERAAAEEREIAEARERELAAAREAEEVRLVRAREAEEARAREIREAEDRRAREARAREEAAKLAREAEEKEVAAAIPAPPAAPAVMIKKEGKEATVATLSDALASIKLKKVQEAQPEKGAAQQPQVIVSETAKEAIKSVLTHNPAAQTKVSEEFKAEVIEFTKEVAAPVIADIKNVVSAVQQLEDLGIKFTPEEVKYAENDTNVKLNTQEANVVLLVAAIMEHVNNNMSPEKGAKTMNVTQVVEEIKKNAEQQAQVTTEAAAAVGDAVNIRIENISVSAPIYVASLGAGVAAGDEDTPAMKKGVWVSGLYGVSKQGATKTAKGYAGNTGGATIGFDLEPTDSSLIGIAYSNVNSHFKYKGGKGDKVSANSHMVSIYGQQQLGERFLLQGIVSGGKSKIQTKVSKLLTSKLASGKLSNSSLSLDTSLSYKIATEAGLVLLPSVGIKYANYKDGAYNETGTGIHNVTMKAKTNSALTGIFGIKALMAKAISVDTQVMPGINASVESYFKNKQQKVKAKLAWMDSYFENTADSGSKGPKVGYNVGASVLIKHKNIEVSPSYNMHMHKKYQSHQGSLKLKVSF